MNKVVVRFADKHAAKGFTNDFFPGRESFHLSPASESGAEPVVIRVSDLKAVFFVHDLAGNREKTDRKEFDPAHPAVGRRIKVVFKDGEVFVGTTHGYQPGRQGFFVVPADATSNIQRCYVVTAATESVSFL
ncbi:MAG TPA: hypothetical protein PLT35_13810 [Vicinamibacterales bacterium]|nr:hypothetical protein [Vicinamibacterales bacterium]HOQ61367.1 hypothetical protein [Vicinamibacterales bacterium]